MTISDKGGRPLRVVIAGAGVAGLEAMLALKALAGGRVTVELLSPESRFVYRPLSVAEPFGLGPAPGFALDDLVQAGGARHRVASLAEVRAAEQIVVTDDGEELEYDALLLAIGASRRPALPGAVTFGAGDGAPAFQQVLEELGSGKFKRVVFALPHAVTWSLPLYELALLTSGWLRRRGIEDAELSLVTHERVALAPFGSRGGEEVEALLQEAGVALRTGLIPERAGEGGLVVGGGEEFEADRVVALPELWVAPLPGVPQDRYGFIRVDGGGRVEGTDGVWAAGDATTFPIKQGGIAAQQADAIAAHVAARAGAEVEAVPPPLVLRGALLTGAAPRFMRTEVFEPDARFATSEGALWWPAGKIAGRYLSPLLARLSGHELPEGALEDLEGFFASDPEAAAAAHREALALALEAADAEAGWGDHETALRWLEVAEQLNVTLPPEYLERRERWSAALGAAPR